MSDKQESMQAAQGTIDRLSAGEESLELDVEEEESEGGYDQGLDIWDRLTNDSHGQDLDQIEAAIDIENGGPNRIKRGAMNMADMKIMRTPMYDIPVGILETAIMFHKGKFDALPGLGGESENEGEENVGEEKPADNRTTEEMETEEDRIRNYSPQ